MTEFDQWYNSLPKHTQEWLRKQPVWHDADMFKVFALGFLIGLCLGFIL